MKQTTQGKHRLGLSPFCAITLLCLSGIPQANAYLVDFDQFSDPPGIINILGEGDTQADAWTVTAPTSSGNLMFTGWYDDWGFRYEDLNGAAENPAFVNLLENTTMTAVYVNAALDADGDGVPDWYELFHYGNTAQFATSDTDHDGYTLREEWYRRYDPHSPEPLTYRWVESSLPTNVLAQTEQYVSGDRTEYATSARYGETNGYRFAYWSVNGTRYADSLGRGLDPVAVPMSASVRVYTAVATYIAATNDTDADAVPDWYELHYYANTNPLPGADPDGDGWNLTVEAAHDTHPELADEIRRNSQAWSESTSFDFVLATSVYYTENSSPTGAIDFRAVYSSGTVITTATANAYGDYRFTHWTVNGLPQADGGGSPVNPVVIALTMDTVATACFMRQDVDDDGDGVPDWYEFVHYFSTNHSASSDTDGDGYDLYEEWYRGYDPRNPEPRSWRYRMSSLPTHILGTTETYIDGLCSSLVTPGLYGDTNGFRFACWTINGVRQEDVLGRALDPVTVRFDDAVRFYDVVATFVQATTNTDTDGVADWYEQHYYGNLDEAGTADRDGDGYLLSEEEAHDTHPGLFDEVIRNAQVRAESDAFDFVLARDLQYDMHSSPAGFIDFSAVYPIGTVVTAQSAIVYGDYRFTYWTTNGECQIDADGTPVNPVVFAIQDDTEAIAWFVQEDQDLDGDSVPDWFEYRYYRNTHETALSDTDGDGYGLFEEWCRSYNPNVAEPLSWRYRLRSSPPTVFAETEVYIAGDIKELDTPSKYGETNGFRFAYWLINGVRQRDALGRGLDPATITFDAGTRFYDIVATYLPATNDVDADGVSDWYEQNYYGALTQPGTADNDFDGYLLGDEQSHDTHPELADLIVRNQHPWAESDVFNFKLREYFDIKECALLNGESTNFFSSHPTAVSGEAFGLNSAPALGDWDGDGDLDLFVAASGGAMRIYRNDGSPAVFNFVELTTNFADMASTWSGIQNPSPSMGDWNNDGDADLAVGGDTGDVRIVSSPGHFLAPQSPAVNYVLQTGHASTIPALIDVTGDALLDLIVLFEDGTVGVYANSGNPTLPFSNPMSTSDLLGIPVPQGTGMSVADVNHDVLPDILISDNTGRCWEFHRQANGTFLLQSKIFASTGAGFATRLTIAAADLDGDGDMDLLCGYHEGGLIYLCNPEKHLRITPVLTTVGTGETIDFSSIDADGTLTWSVPVNRSGGSINPTNGLYQAGPTAGIDQVQARNAAGRTGVAWVNVVDRGSGTGNKWRALLVDGRRGPNDPVWPAAHALNTRAREVLLYRGLTDDQILWLGHGATNTGPDALPTRAALASALRDGTSLAADTDVFMVYLVDHGRVAPNGDGLFLLSESEFVTGPELNAWLDTLQAARPTLSVVVVIESCYGGRVASPLAASDTYSARRLVLTSSGTNELAHLAAGGLVSYSTMWWSGAAAGRTFGQAHDDAAAAMVTLQSAQRGSGGAVLAASKLGLDGVSGSGRPIVIATTNDIQLQGTQEALLAVSVESSFAVEKVWGVVVPPGYRASGDAPVVDLTEVELARDNASGQWTALVGGFTEGGAPYTVLVQARDVWGQVSAPALIRITQVTVRNRVIVFAHGEEAWLGAPVAGSLAEYAREVALLRRVRAEDVKMIADGVFGIEDAEPASPAALQAALETWANGDGHLAALTVFAVGQGSQEGLVCADGDLVTPAALKGWLDGLQEESGALVQLIVDSDYSGRFVAGAGSSEHRRVVISSTGPNVRNTFDSGRWGGVTGWIWNSIARGRDLRESYDESTDLLKMIGVTVPSLFDDNGDGMFTKLLDGLNAINAFVGSAYVTADDPPFIGKASASQQVASGQTARFRVSSIVMPDGTQPASVWCEVVGPDGTPRGGSDLWRNYTKDRYEGSFSAFTEPGRYFVFVQAGTKGDPARTTPPAVVFLDYITTPDSGAPVIEGLPALALPLDGRTMDVESDAGGEWRLPLTRGQRVVVEVREVSAGRDVVLRLVGAGGRVLASSDGWGLGFGENIDGWEAPADGFYVVRATFAPGSGAAECKVRAYIKREAGIESLVSLPPQTINFTLPTEQALSNGPLSLVATASSGLLPRFEILSGPASITGAILTASGTGVVTVVALQDGNDEWDSAEPVVRTITITATTNAYEAWARGIFGVDYATKGGPDQDYDGDGCSNLNEWLAHTDAQNLEDRFEIISAASDATTFAIRWLARQGVHYRVLFSTDLAAWTECPGSRVIGAGVEVVLEPDSSGYWKFYRVEVVVP